MSEYVFTSSYYLSKPLTAPSDPATAAFASASPLETTGTSTQVNESATSALGASESRLTAGPRVTSTTDAQLSEELEENMVEDNTEHTEDAVPTFPRFARLPTEIQQMIWNHAVPNPRRIPNSILVFVNYDLNRPRAILPSPTSSLRFIGTNNGSYQRQRENDKRRCKHVLSLLHTCHNSRASAGAIFSLDVGESVEAWNTKLWDPATDTLYMPGLPSGSSREFLRWLWDRRDQPQIGLKSAAHIALPLDRHFLHATKAFAEVTPSAIYYRCVQNQWLQNLPAMETLRLCIDPRNHNKHRHGHLVPYPSLDVPVGGLNRLLPSTIRKGVTGLFEEHTADLVLRDVSRPDFKAPVVDISVLCWRKSFSKPPKAERPA